MNKPSVGRIVHFHYENTEGNPGSLTAAAAVITHVHSDSCVTLEVFLSPYAPKHEQDLGRQRTSVLLRDEAEKHGATWPPRV